MFRQSSARCGVLSYIDYWYCAAGPYGDAFLCYSKTRGPCLLFGCAQGRVAGRSLLAADVTLRRGQTEPLGLDGAGLKEPGTRLNYLVALPS